MKWLTSSMKILTVVLEWAVTLCFFVILMLTITLVVLRYVFNTSILGGNELMEYLFIYTTAIGAAAVLSRREHIKITWFVEKLRPVFRKIAAVLNYVLIAVLNGIMIYYCLPWLKATGKFETPVLRLPRILVQIVVPVGCGLAILFCIFHIILIITGHKSPGKSTEAAE